MCNLGRVIDLLWFDEDFNDPKVLIKCIVCRCTYVCHFHDKPLAPQLNDLFVFEVEVGRKGKLIEVCYCIVLEVDKNYCCS